MYTNWRARCSPWKRNNLKRKFWKKKIILSFFNLLHSPVINKCPQKNSAQSVQPFGWLYATYIYECNKKTYWIYIIETCKYTLFISLTLVAVNLFTFLYLKIHSSTQTLVVYWYIRCKVEKTAFEELYQDWYKRENTVSVLSWFDTYLSITRVVSGLIPIWGYRESCIRIDTNLRIHFVLYLDLMLTWI